MKLFSPVGSVRTPKARTSVSIVSYGFACGLSDFIFRSVNLSFSFMVQLLEATFEATNFVPSSDIS